MCFDAKSVGFWQFFWVFLFWQGVGMRGIARLLLMGGGVGLTKRRFLAALMLLYRNATTPVSKAWGGGIW
jgi:hypothetical protein